VHAAGPPAAPAEADAIVSTEPARPVGVATADCLPILLAARGGEAVAAVHAGWRGLARGVIPAAVAALGRVAGASAGLVAVLGPHIGPCCYEVDEPVLGPLRERFGAGLGPALRPGRPAHAWLDLGLLGRAALLEAGLAAEDVGFLPDTCTRCDSRRFHSFRRDGPRAGRLLHFAAARTQTKS
jgi:YfiH family protein